MCSRDIFTFILRPSFSTEIQHLICDCVGVFWDAFWFPKLWVFYYCHALVIIDNTECNLRQECHATTNSTEQLYIFRLEQIPASSCLHELCVKEISSGAMKKQFKGQATPTISKFCWAKHFLHLLPQQKLTVTFTHIHAAFYICMSYRVVQSVLIHSAERDSSP